MKYDKTATIVLALCISMGIHTKADARWNWYDRVLQPIVSNQVSPAWQAMINTAEQKLVQAYQEYIEKIASGVGSIGGIGKDIQKGDTVAESKEDLNTALNELFLENMKKTTTIESIQPGMFDFTKKVLDANVKDREEADDKRETLIGLNKGVYDDGKGTFVKTESLQTNDGEIESKSTTYTQIINPDGTVKKADKLQRNSVVIKYVTPTDGVNEGIEDKQRTPEAISISTPSGQAMLHPEVYYETKSTMQNYQFKVFNERMEENRDSLARINAIMTKINELEKVGTPKSSDQAEVSKLVASITSQIADETLNLERANRASDNVNKKYEEADKKCAEEMDVNAGLITDHANELEVLFNEQEWLDDYIDSNSWRWNDDYYDDIVPTSVLQARLDSIKNTGAGTQAVQDEIAWLENLINPPEGNYYNSYYWDDEYGVYHRYRGYYDEDGYFHYYGARYSDLQQRLRTVETNIKSEEALVKEYCDKFENAYATYEKHLKEYASEAHSAHEKSSSSLQNLASLALQLAQAKNSIGTTSQQEKERKAMVDSLSAELAVETAKLESGSNRLDQAIDIYKKESHEVERKKAIAAMSFQGFDPYNLSDSEKEAGMETPEQLDKGYVTRKGKRKL